MRDPLGPAGSPYGATVPAERLFLMGDNRLQADDSRYFLDEQSGSVSASDVRGHVRAEGAAPLVPWVMEGFAALLALVGIGWRIWGYATRQRSLVRR
ncbi:S26 family signal peptidase [Streptomyces hydrogenans]|uniref:S26 family signal peptidase n=1 Tax=Streptomyces hydrogenans TaxID=1873719 RepID=UPI0036BA2A32